MTMHRQYSDQDGSGSPIGSVTPHYVGQLYFDTDEKYIYRASGLTNVDWIQYLGHSSDEKKYWQVQLAKLRPSLLQKASSNFTPTGYDVFPIVGHDWRTGTTSEFFHGPGYPNTGVVKSGTPINFAGDGWLFYVTSTDAYSTSDDVQEVDPGAEYYKRLGYIHDVEYQTLTAWMVDNGWDTQALTPGTYGGLLITLSFNNIREFNISDVSYAQYLYHGNYISNGIKNWGYARHEDKFYIPYDVTLAFDVRAANTPAGGGTYVVKYIDVPSWW